MDVTYGRNFHLGAPDARQHEMPFSPRDILHFCELPFMLCLALQVLGLNAARWSLGITIVTLRKQRNRSLLHGDCLCKLLVSLFIYLFHF